MHSHLIHKVLDTCHNLLNFGLAYDFDGDHVFVVVAPATTRLLSMFTHTHYHFPIGTFAQFEGQLVTLMEVTLDYISVEVRFPMEAVRFRRGEEEKAMATTRKRKYVLEKGML